MPFMGSSKPKPRIRIDAGELGFTHFETTSVWEFCRDEEDIEDQSECTMRPLVTKGPLSWPMFDGMIAADLTLANGARHLGVVGPNSSKYVEPLRCFVCLLLPLPIPGTPATAEPEGWNPYISGGRINLDNLCDAPPVPEVDFAYKVLGLTPEQVWPVTIVPRVPIKNWPAKLTLSLR